MKYAIISDVHGNTGALSAVLKDAENMNVDKYIFVGDYCSYFHCPNEVIEIISNLENAIVIQGNEDGNLTKYAKQDQRTWTDGQFQAHYWLYKNLKDKNHIYLRELPQSISFKDKDITITVTHKSSDVYGDIEYREFSSQQTAQRYQNNPAYARDMLLHDIQEYLYANAAFHTAVQSLTDDIYIFGHTHMQWHMQYENKTFINSGSCGLPLDGTSGAPYTLLHIDNNQICITERRIPYDIDSIFLEFKDSDLYKEAPVWSGIVLEEATMKFARALPFLRFVDSYANKINDHVRPYSIKTWTEAYAIWQLQ